MIRTDTTPHHITASALVGGPRPLLEVRGNTGSMPALLTHSMVRGECLMEPGHGAILAFRKRLEQGVGT